MAKNYIADTNALLRNPEVLDEYSVIIPSHVNREIEHLELTRKQDRTLQWQIRRFKKKCDENDNAYVNIKDYKFTLDDDLDPSYTDNILLQVAHDERYGIITNDRLLRRKCKQFGIEYINPETETFVEHKGFKEVYLIKEELDEIYANLHINKYDLLVNEYLIVFDDLATGELDPLNDVLDIFKWDGESMVALKKSKRNGKLDLSFKTNKFDKFTPKDAYQMIAVDSIQSNQITQIRGRAGSGKSKIALETLWKMKEVGDLDRIVIFVNPTPTRGAQEMGFYKGDKLEKLMQSSVGAMLISKFGDEIAIQQEILYGNLDIQPLVDIRGYETGDRKTGVWILEAQNTTVDLMKLGLQRISENTIVVIDGDFWAQVDRDEYQAQNGMKRTSEVFRGEDLYGEVELQYIYRSRVAEIADRM